MILTLAARELRSMFLSPLAWAILAAIQFVVAWLFLIQVDTYTGIQARLASIDGAPGMTTLIAAQIISNTGFILMLVVPLLTMRLLSEELRSQTIQLLFSAPVSMTEIILGKFLGILGFLFIMIAMLMLMPLSLLLGGTLDMGMFAAGVIGLLLMVSSFAALGLFISSLTQQPVVAAISTFAALLLLRLLDWAGNVSDSEGFSGLFAYASILRHFETLLLGKFASTDVIYYVLFIVTFLILTIRRMDAYRLQH
jgi:ABC-2 type transport system permease protein